MSQPLSIQELEKLFSLMEAMLHEAKNSNWEVLTKLDEERRNLLNYKPNPDVKRVKELEPRPLDNSKNSPSTSTNTTQIKPDQEYEILSAKVLELDKIITKTVQKARSSLVEENREAQAQVMAKKSYDFANSVQASVAS